jgi:Ca-activated chloride channel family protein
MSSKRSYVAAPSTYMPSSGATGAIAAPDAESGNQFHDWGRNPWVDAQKDHLSTFAADVDTASYTIMRRNLNENTLPDPASVRVEEFVNYFRYDFAAPAQDTPFSVVVQAAPSPMNEGTHILRVGVATKAKTAQERKPAHLVFLVDVSGSMGSADKIGLAQKSLRILTENLGPRDTVSLVTYAGATRVVLQPTGMENRDQIFAAIDGLMAGGSTAMASGLDLAYEQAMKGLMPGAVARVIVLTDGDANVGPTGHESLLQIIASRAKQGVTLSTIGFGMGNLHDNDLEQLADKGDGNSFYIDSQAAAHKVFEEQLGSTLEVVAKDAKLQVDFDPTLVAKYRLLGYENRDIADNDFRKDEVDAGEMGAGHQVTAMYEVQLTDAGRAANAPLATVRIRHKQPEGSVATEKAFAMLGTPAASFDAAPADLRFAFAVAAFADVLRGGDEANGWSLAKIAEEAKSAAGADKDRLEFVSLIEKARTLRSDKQAQVAR